MGQGGEGAVAPRPTPWLLLLMLYTVLAQHCYIAVRTLFLWAQMHVWWSVHSVCVSVINLTVIQIKVCQRFVCVVFVDSPHYSNEDHVEITLYPCLFRLAISMLCCAFALWSWGSGLVSSHILNSIRWTSHWFWFSFMSLAFFFWWGLLHGPQQGPDRMKEKTYKTGKRKTPA